ncbi:hypothetical protein M3Y97_01122700 [Aphelenchoides bicaudatus]|nr:hypothetical protein M3Y97_01122700 [Aphelenchoides bicaudatus]
MDETLEGFVFLVLLFGSIFTTKYVVGFLSYLLQSVSQQLTHLANIFGICFLIGSALFVPKIIEVIHESSSKAVHAKPSPPLKLTREAASKDEEEHISEYPEALHTDYDVTSLSTDSDSFETPACLVSEAED